MIRCRRRKDDALSWKFFDLIAMCLLPKLQFVYRGERKDHDIGGILVAPQHLSAIGTSKFRPFMTPTIPFISSPGNRL